MSRKIYHYVETTEMYRLFMLHIQSEQYMNFYVAYEENQSLASHLSGSGLT
jgi:hypothetical protein